MMSKSPDRSHRRRSRAWRIVGSLPLLGVIGLLSLGGLIGPAAAQEDAVLGAQVQIVAQGVAEVPAGDVVWRTVRARADPTATAPFAERPLSFVIAREEAMLLADDRLAYLALLFPDEAAFVPPGVVQQRSSLSDAPVNYLAIELVPADAALATDGATVLQPGQPFPSPGGYRDFDLVQGFLTADDLFTVPDTGQKNIILITDGGIAVGRAGAEPTTLIAGESATFTGELEVAGTTPETASFVVAIIGDEVIPPVVEAAVATTPPESPTAEPAATTPATTPVTPAGTGSITVQALLCPPGMTEQTVLPNLCEPTTSEFQATLSGPALPAPLILSDATPVDGAYQWSGLPFGEYRLAEAVLPENYESYVLVGAPATGDALTGYTVTLSAETPDLSVQFFNFVSE
jgi:hypothetical protein